MGSTRPRAVFRVDPSVSAILATPASASYPAEHAVAVGAAAAILGYIFPEDAALFSSDVTAGKAIGRQVAAKPIAGAQRDDAQ